MEQLLTANVATNLYWLGRYIVRVEATLQQINLVYDDIIDVNKDAGVELYKKFGIDLSYENAQEFLKEAILGEHDANIHTLMGYARENAIISRNHLNSNAFGEIIALHEIFQNASSDLQAIDYKLIDTANSLISEIWGELSKKDQVKASDYFLTLGKLSESLDFNIRFDYDIELSKNMIEKIDTIYDRLKSENVPKEKNLDKAVELNPQIMNDIYKKIESLIVT